MARGYTEPDPRDDLSGMDVARKALILARLLGYPGELSRTAVESLVPKWARALPLAEFLERLEELDAGWQRRVDDAARRRHGAPLRGAVTPSKIAVGLQAGAGLEPARRHQGLGQPARVHDGALQGQPARHHRPRRRRRGHGGGRAQRHPPPGGRMTAAVVPATAFAPGGVGNVGPGLDILGLAVAGAGDTVRAEWTGEAGIHLRDAGHPDLPSDPARHTSALRRASRARGRP